MEAEDPDFPGIPGAITYSLAAGVLPAGVQINTTGVIEGIPTSTVDVRGVPLEVSENVTSKFVIRATDAENRIADRTFELTVTGQDAPTWITPSGSIGYWFDGTSLSFQFTAAETDPGDTIEITLLAGSIPDGLTLTTDGLLSGFITQFSLIALKGSRDFDFTLKLTDGKDVVTRDFSIFVYDRSSMSADSGAGPTVDNTNLLVDSTGITADNGPGPTVDDTDITVDSLGTYSPYITNNVPFIGDFRHDNYFAHQFLGVDPLGSPVKYFVSYGTGTSNINASQDDITADQNTVTADSSSLPPGLSLNADTGWLTGYMPVINETEITYDFGVSVFAEGNPTETSPIYLTSMTIFGDVNTEVLWITDADLGIITNGAVSMLNVEAVAVGEELFYRLAPSGVYNKLPQGLQLLPSGNIVGQVSFKTFNLDGGTTTIDDTALTTVDSDYRFTVEAYTLSGSVSITKEFVVAVHREYDVPFNSVYCKAMPPVADRDLLATLLANTTVLPTDSLYRADDPNFGLATDVIYNHAFGLTPATVEQYTTALELNHYNKNLILGEIKTARALDANENIIYEVVYSQINDTLVNAEGESVPAEVPIKYPAIDNGSPVDVVYPNSLVDMRDQVIDTIGQTSKVLPQWMLSKQADGTVLGFTPAWVIAYTKPGEAQFLQYNITEFFGTQLNLIDFEIDRYSLDLGLLQYWGITADSVNLTADSPILVSDSAIWKRAVITTYDRALSTPDNIYETIFDDGSSRFISPVDIYDATDELDKYIKFPRTQIINNEQ